MVERIAKKLARKSPATNFKHAAVITRKGKFIAGAHNVTSFNGPAPHLHAERRAIKKARSVLNRMRPGDDLSDCEMLVIRINRNGDLLLSKPCPNCQKAIDACGIKKVEWS
jgi:tRNA(Arg) A34 adenosine deaminase TadA